MGISISKNAETTLEERYLLRDENGEVTETPEQLFWRVAKNVASVEKNDVGHWENTFFELITPQEEQHGADFLPNTPTLMNAGLPKGQLSACFVLPVEDSIEGIFETLKHAAIIHQSGGGTGFSFSRLRQKDAMVDSKQGVASGPQSFASVYNQATEIMKQGGKRKGANMYVENVHHPDADSFIDMKTTPGVMENFNVSVGLTDAFMEACKNGEDYDVIDPRDGSVVERRSAKDTLERIARNAAASAEPGVLFMDRINAKSPYEEVIEATNPCGEQPLPPYGACNLGSINLSNFVRRVEKLDGGYYEVDWSRLEKVTRVATRFLDNVIDANHYPIPEIDAHAKKYRNIGLGFMGFADMLLFLGMRYGDKESIALARQIGKFVNEISHNESANLGLEKGYPSAAPFKTFFDYSSCWRRNATLTTIAPTGSLCILACCSSGCEPNFAWVLEKHVMEQILVEHHWIAARAKEEGWFDDRVFVEAHEITPEEHVLIQAAFQEHCDSAISKTCNLPRGSTWEDVLGAYVLAYDNGCKGITVYVDGSREGVLHKHIEKDDAGDDVEELDLVKEHDCCDSPNIRMEAGCETCYNCHTSKCLVA